MQVDVTACCHRFATFSRRVSPTALFVSVGNGKWRLMMSATSLFRLCFDSSKNDILLVAKLWKLFPFLPAGGAHLHDSICSCKSKWLLCFSCPQMSLSSSSDPLLCCFYARYQCFKSAWVYEVLHSGFRFPTNYPNLKTAQLVYDKEVQWTLGAILYKTRFLPLR